MTKNDYYIVNNEDVLKAFIINPYGDYETAWQNFRKAFPGAGGLYSFSRIGFSADKKYALFFVSMVCEGLCGEGNYYLLKKTNGAWNVHKKQMTWIS